MLIKGPTDLSLGPAWPSDVRCYLCATVSDANDFFGRRPVLSNVDSESEPAERPVARSRAGLDFVNVVLCKAAEQ